MLKRMSMHQQVQQQNYKKSTKLATTTITTYQQRWYNNCFLFLIVVVIFMFFETTTIEPDEFIWILQPSLHLSPIQNLSPRKYHHNNKKIIGYYVSSFGFDYKNNNNNRRTRSLRKRDQVVYPICLTNPYHSISMNREITKRRIQPSSILSSLQQSNQKDDNNHHHHNRDEDGYITNDTTTTDDESFETFFQVNSKRPTSICTTSTTTMFSNRKDVIEIGKDNKNNNGNSNVGGYDPSERISTGKKVINVGDPQIKIRNEKEFSVTSILKELAAIQQQGPQKYCILGTRHCSYLHQQIIELLAYALVLSGNHVYTSGAGGTHAATIRGALRAERPELLTVVLPQSMGKQPLESQKLLKKVEDIISMPQNDELSLDVASRICNSYLLSQTDQLISFLFHESTTIIEATKEAKELDKLVTVLYLD